MSRTASFWIAAFASIAAASCGDNTPPAGSLIASAAEPPGTNCPAGGVRFDVGLDKNGNGKLEADEVTSSEFTCNGSNGAPAESLVKATAEAPGANCTFGGQRIDYGIDDNHDRVLSTDEIDGTTYVCNGVDGSQSTLVTTTAESAGANCAHGGTRIDRGADDNSDGILQASEIETTSYICNGGDGLQSLVTTVAEPQGANCANGGSRVDYGVDDNADSALQSTEIDGTFYVCNSLQALVAVVAEPPGANCAGGGSRVQYGVDANGDGTLAGTEITGFTFVCNGVNGTNGLRSLVKTATEAPGTNCATGGVRVDQGLDTSGDNVLQTGEINSTAYVCNGATGPTGLGSLVKTTAEPAGTNCTAGGTRIQAGVDTNSNTVLDATEVTSTSFACNALKSLVATATETPGANCATGGTKISVGVDLNNDNALQGIEVSSISFVCTGANGTNGTNGTNGFTALVNQAVEPPGGTCTNGGLRVTSGLDTDRNGVLGSTEVLATSFVCNGANGSNGTNGQPGAPVLVVVTTEPNGANCTTGGTRIQAGYDANNNGVLAGAEITSTAYICNPVPPPVNMVGADGSDNGNSIGGNLYGIDPTTGQSRAIGPLNGEFRAIAYDGAGVLYGVELNSGALYTISTSTAQTTFVASTGIPRARDMVFDKTTGTMYVLANRQGGAGWYSVDLTNGAAAQLGSLYNCVGSLAARADGTIFMDDNCQGFGTVDPSTGIFSNVGGGSQQLTGMAFVNGTLYGIYGRNNCGGAGCASRSLVTVDQTNGTIAGVLNGLSGRLDSLTAK